MSHKRRRKAVTSVVVRERADKNTRTKTKTNTSANTKTNTYTNTNWLTKKTICAAV